MIYKIIEITPHENTFLGNKPTIFDNLAAEQAQISPSRLTQLFRQTLGQTPTQHVESQRLNQARQLLARTTQPISAISQAVGYENPFYFTLHFKRETGLAPTEYRKRINADDGS